MLLDPGSQSRLEGVVRLEFLDEHSIGGPRLRITRCPAPGCPPTRFNDSNASYHGWFSERLIRTSCHRGGFSRCIQRSPAKRYRNLPHCSLSRKESCFVLGSVNLPVVWGYIGCTSLYKLLCGNGHWFSVSIVMCKFSVNARAQRCASVDNQ